MKNVAPPEARTTRLCTSPSGTTIALPLSRCSKNRVPFRLAFPFTSRRSAGGRSLPNLDPMPTFPL